MSNKLKNLPRSPNVMEPGELAPLIAIFAAELEALSYTRLTVTNYIDSARHFAAWLRQADIGLVEVDRNVLDRFAQHACRCGGARHCPRLSPRYLRRVRRFVDFLVDQGLVTAPTGRAIDVVDCRVADFLQWLERHRGICPSTIKRHGCMVTRLLTALGSDPSVYDAALIRRVILVEAQRCSASHVKTMTTALRGYLRYLAVAGLCAPGLYQAVPFIPQWRLASLPRYLVSADVKRLIASCNLDTGHGIRDRAILLLFARLGLRIGDVGDMRLDDIDWTAATVLVRGKGRRETRLPLPQDVGDAVLAYIDQARPVVDEERLFLRSCAPYRRFTNASTVSSVVRLALRRAAIENPPSRGGNLLRHSAATTMLRGGATLQSVGAVLRHNSLDTTAHYAKVDLPMLQRVVQPWPGA